MAVITTSLVPPTSANIEKIHKYEKGLIAFFGEQMFKEMAPSDPKELCSQIVSYISKNANEEQKSKIRAIFPAGAGVDSISEICLKMRRLLNVGIEGCEEGASLVDDFEQTIVDDLESGMRMTMASKLRQAVEKGDTVDLEKLKPLCEAFNINLLEEVDDIARMSYQCYKTSNSKAVMDWVMSQKDDKKI